MPLILADYYDALLCRSLNGLAILDAVETSSRFYIVSELVVGPPVLDLITRRTRLLDEEIRVLVASLAQTIAALQELGVVHGGIKPGTLVLARAFLFKQGPISSFNS